MINDSTNVRVIADNIKKLEKMVKEAGSELPTPGVGDTGKILKVGSDGYELATEYSYTPPAFSTSEVNTGYQWIDGKDIFQIVFTGQLPVIESSSVNVLISENFDADLILERFEMIRDVSGNQHCDQHYVKYYPNNKHLEISGLGSGFTECNYIIILLYTKPSPTPEPTTSTKKTTKKG